MSFRSQLFAFWFRRAREPLSLHRLRLRRLVVEGLEYRQLMAGLDLASLAIDQGVSFLGVDARDVSGTTVKGAGDVNGDGYEDFLIGAFLADSTGNARLNAGESYLVFGASALVGAIDLASLGPSGVTLFGAEAADVSGRSVSGVGDVNGDGFDDLLIGAYGADALGNSKSYAGDSYVIYGNAVMPSTIELATVGASGGAPGFAIYGIEAGDRSGFSVSAAGDVNGDGFDDLLIGAYRADADANLKEDAGESYLLFGGMALSSTIDLSLLGTVAGPSGAIIYGADAGDRSGFSVSAAGDVNGDGYADIAIGAPLADSTNDAKASAGDSYLIYGAAILPLAIDLASLGSSGVVIRGVDSNDRSGISISRAGDLNGDGFDDLLIGAFFADAGGNTRSNSGDSYVIFGSSGLPAEIELASIGTSGAAGITFWGSEAGDLSGRSVSSAGDFNGDGFDDLLIGANRGDAAANSKLDAGESYLILGGSSLPTAFDLSSLASAPLSIGLTLFGEEAGDQSGIAVSAVGDVNGDGFDDLLIGADSADAAGNAKTYAGGSYLIYGDDLTGSITHLGSPGNETLVGTNNADRMVGDRGDDLLLGNGGNDLLIGGKGNDTLAIEELPFLRAVGGSGIDTLRIDGSSMTLDLTAIPDNRILDIEEIDLSGTGSHTLVLNYLEVLNLSRSQNTVIVHRNVGDIVQIGNGWTQGLNEMMGSDEYLVYTQGIATLKVQAVASNVTNRQVFYNRSQNLLFGNGSGNPLNAIDPSKTALLPGQSPSFANYTNYFLGLNGIIVDLANLTSVPTAADIRFETSDGSSPLTFSPSSAIAAISVIPEGGQRGEARLKIEFENHAIRNTWLRVTILANSNTQLTANDVFYFGNAVGDMGVGNSGTPTLVRTNATDTSAVRQNQSTIPNSAGISSIYDLNKDGRVNSIDTAIVRQNQTPLGTIRYFIAPTSFVVGAHAVPLFDDSGTLDSVSERGRTRATKSLRSIQDRLSR